MTAEPVLPYARHRVDEDDVRAVVDVLRSDWLTTGPAVAAFEAALAQAVQAPFAIACSSGTAALHLAALTLDLKPSDAVIVPAVTFVATANAARYVGAEVVFADVDPDTGLMRAQDLEAALARIPANYAARAVFPVHLNGQCADTDAIHAIAAARGLKIVEDACHALGTRYGDAVAVGAAAHADLVAFSFHPAKTVTMGEGGAVTTRDPDLARRLMRLRDHGLVRTAEAFTQAALARDAHGHPNPWYYELAEPGFNYRASDIHCALGRSQLDKLERFVTRRRELAALYDRALAPLVPMVRTIARVSRCVPAWHLYVVMIDFEAAGRDRATVMNGLRERGIGTQVHYMPVHRQPYYRGRHGDRTLPGADAYYRRCLSLPLFPAMMDDDVARVVQALAEVLA